MSTFAGRSVAIVASLSMAAGACGGEGEPTRLTVIAAVDVGERASGVAVGEEAVWAVDGDRTLVRLDPESSSITARIDVPAGAHQLAVGEGGVWVSGRSAVSRVDPTAERVTATVELGSPRGLAAGRGAVWVANGRDDGTLNRLDPERVRVSATIKVPPHPEETLPIPQDPGHVAVGEGGVWVTDRRVGTVSRIDPGSNRVTLTKDRVGLDPTGLAIGEGHIWVVSTLSLHRVDPGERFPDSFEVVDMPTGAAVGAGAVWVANFGNDTLVRIDPETGRRTAAIELQESPVGVAVGFGSVWVVGNQGLLSRVSQS
jgi:virginiamycin B lyase